jgi:hypothetical protein
LLSFEVTSPRSPMAAIRKSVFTVVFWRAVRLAAPIALISCGPVNVKVVSPGPVACAPGQFATCTTGSVQVLTDLPPGTELSRHDCDWICLSVNCASEEKRCTVQSQPLTQDRIVVCQSVGFQGCAVAGRPPAGLELRLSAPSSASELFAQMAIFEAASVTAFEELSAFLSVAGAPRALVERAHRAAGEERRHAQVATQLAGLLEIPEPRVAARVVPLTLARLAEENFCDGCVNEAASAVLTASQAQNAADPMVREALGQVAADELGHAEFSWELHAWLVPQLTSAERAALREAGMKKAAAMLDPVAAALDGPARAAVGLPELQSLRAQHRLLFEELWTPALDALA